MIFYLCIIGITLILAYLYQHSVKKQKKCLFVLLVLFPGLISGLRGVATDYVFYANNYNQIIDGQFIYADYKSILVQFVKIVGRIGLPFQLSITIVSLSTIYFAFKIFDIYKEDINFTIAVFSYMTMFYQMSFNIFRQFLAAEIFLLASVYLFKKNNKYRFIALYILSVCIHSSLLPFGIVLFMSKTIYNEKYYKKRLLIFFICLVGIFALPLIIEKIMFIIPLLSHYAWFLTRFKYNKIGLGFVRNLVLAIIPAIFVFIKKKYKNMSQIGLSFTMFYAVLGSIIWLSSYISTSSLYRLGYNLLVSLPLMHGYLFKNYRNKMKLIILCSVIFTLLLFWYYDGVVLDSGETIPYKFFWK